jgi:hypothetical protein
MQNRNGKTQHHTGDTLALLEMPADSQGVTNESSGVTNRLLGMPSESSGVANESSGGTNGSSGVTNGLLGMPSESSGVANESSGGTKVASGRPSRRHGATFSANDSIAKRLAAAQQAIDAVLADRELLAALAMHGYSAARMAEGKALYDKAQALQQQQRQRYGERARATDAHAGLQARIRLTYSQHRSKARVALRADRGAAQMLDLDARLPSTQAGWMLQARQFYANALADGAILRALASYNLTEAHLAAAQVQVAAVAAGAVARQASRSAAQAGTQARNTALETLNRWMRDFLAIARIALADQPQRLAQLGQ